MHFLSFTSVVLSLAASIEALAELEDRAACVRDQCLYAVLNSNVPARSTDCSTFLTKTVTPCPVTVTATATNYQAVASVTNVITLSSACVITKTTTTSTTAAVIFGTGNCKRANIQGRPTLVIPTTSCGLYTVGQTVMSAREFDENAELNARGSFSIAPTVTTCTPSTMTPNAIPTYASSCPSAARFSSACSCLGYVTGVKTLSAATVTVSSTITRPSTVTGTSTISTLTVTQTTILTLNPTESVW